MSPRAAKTCARLDCPELQPCPTHQRKPWEGSTRRTELPPDWERRRRRVLARDEWCRPCPPDLPALATEVHHTGDKHDHRLESLQGVCRDCHRRVTLEQAADARRNTTRG